MKKTVKILLVVIGTLLGASLFLYIFVATGAFAMLYDKPPKPQIAYGEFPFTLTYEYDGEIKVIKDTIVCEFDGYDHRGTAGIYRKWKTSLKSGDERITLADLRSSVIMKKDGSHGKVLELYFDYGSGGYYMGDNSIYSTVRTPDADFRILYEYPSNGGKTTVSSYSYVQREPFEKYNIRIISWDVASPIHNTFGNTDGFPERKK